MLILSALNLLLGMILFTSLLLTLRLFTNRCGLVLVASAIYLLGSHLPAGRFWQLARWFVPHFDIFQERLEADQFQRFGFHLLYFTVWMLYLWYWRKRRASW